MLDPIKVALRHGINGMCKSLDDKPDQQHPAPPCAIPCKLCREGAAAAIAAFLRACPVLTDLPPGMDRMGFWDEEARERWAAAVEGAA